MACSVLSISYDESLLRTREMILAREGYEVTSALGFADSLAKCKNSTFDLAIIGHSIPLQEKAVLLTQLRAHGQSRVLSLRRDIDAPLAGVDCSIEASEGPEVLLAAVKALAAKPTDSNS